MSIRATIDHSRRLSTIHDDEDDRFDHAAFQAERSAIDQQWGEYAGQDNDDEHGYPLPLGWTRGE